MAIHPSHPIPLAAKVVPPTSSSRNPASPSSGGGQPTRPFPTSSDGPSLALRASSSSSPAPPPPAAPPSALPQSYTTQLSDLLLSAVVPGIPKTKGKGGAGGGASKLVDSEGRRLLTSKKEELNLTTTTQNFRKFVLKIGWLFTLQDHIEQLIFWHRPSHSVLFLISWTILSFKPHLLLLLPPIILLAFLLAPYNLPPLKVSLPTLRATPVWEDEDGGSGESDEEAGRKRERRTSASSPTRKGSVGVGRSFSVSGTSGDRAGRKAETSAQTHALIEERKIEANLSSVYYQNIQGIQNLMGTFADGYDSLAPPLTTFFSPTHPLHQTFIAASLVSLLLLSFFASSIPPYAILLPVGWGPLLVGLIPPTTSLPITPPPALTAILSKLHLLILNDRIPPHLLSRPRRTVAVFESQKFGPPGSSNAKEGSGWGESNWGGREVGSSLPGLGGGGGESGAAVVHGLSELVLEPKEEWEWLPGEEWYVDRGGEWVDGGSVGVDAEGWSYLNSHHQPSSTPYTSVGPVGASGEDVEVGTVRRRRWWRRGVKVVDE